MDKENLYTAEQAKATRKWIFRMSLRTYYLPVMVYACISWYFLSCPMDEWILNLGQYNQTFLSIFSDAQYWVNISPVYREKMILLYVLFQLFFWYVLLITIYEVFFNRIRFGADYIPVKLGLCNKPGLMMLMFIIVFSLVIFGFLWNFSLGSEEFLTVAQLDNTNRKWIFTDDAQWNSIFGFLFNKSGHILLVGPMLIELIKLFSTMKFCSRNKSFL